VTLARSQALFWQAVRAKRAPAALRELFVGRGALSVDKRMQIYRAAYWSRHEKALFESYPRLYEHMGVAAFRELVAGYIERHPSTEPSIERAGAALATYIGACAALGEQRFALRELAQLEWARVLALLADDPEQAFEASALGAGDAPTRALRMLPSLSIVGSRAIWRGARGVTELALFGDEARALERALQSDPLSAVCAEFHEPDAAERARRALAAWIARGWITALEEPCAR